MLAKVLNAILKYVRNSMDINDLLKLATSPTYAGAKVVYFFPRLPPANTRPGYVRSYVRM